ncbi:MAG TPA: MoaD/ThiS family protein [Phycisphaerales bacterium]|nr:MoaD/ThiS family protein [Phycisphaerales bacterium]HMP37750.1 MoaD/ThiS family protein [Phycisphaerales bacterium]
MSDERAIRVRMPHHLRTISGVEGEVIVRVEAGAGGAVTQRSILDALEAAHPALVGTIRDQASGRRRPFIRFFACRRDLSHDAPDAPVPEEVARGDEPFLVVGAIAGG